MSLGSGFCGCQALPFVVEADGISSVSIHAGDIGSCIIGLIWRHSCKDSEILAMLSVMLSDGELCRQSCSWIFMSIISSVFEDKICSVLLGDYCGPCGIF